VRRQPFRDLLLQRKRLERSVASGGFILRL
jgi:hypothetical protein